MADAPKYDADAFNRFEHEGWRRAAVAYAGVFDALTSQVVPHLLRAVDARSGTRLLDVACGPGTLAAAAAAQGADAVGMDFAEEQVAIAQARNPGIAFQQGDAEALDIPDASFDAVACAFGILHFGHPERAIAEAFRVLKPGGRYGITAWLAPAGPSLFSLVGGAFQAHAELTEPLPAGPDFFLFGRPGAARQALADAGFADVATDELALTARFEAAETLLGTIAAGSVRTRGMIERLTPQSREKVETAVREGARKFATAQGVEIPAPALMTVGRKP